MKKSVLFSAIAVLGLICACNKDNGNGGRRSEEQEDNPEKEQSEVTVLENAAAGFYGDYYETGTENYYAEFWTGEIDEETFSFVGDYCSVVIDFLTPADGLLAIQPGTYTCSSKHGEFTFVEGEKSEYGVEGSSISIAIGKASWELLVIDGTVTVESTSNGYDVTMHLKGGDNSWYDFSYSGDIQITDMTEEEEEEEEEDDDDDEEGDFENMKFSACVAANYGDYYDSNADNWVIELINDDFDETGNEMYIELQTRTGATSIPAGTYKVSDSFAVNTVIAAYEEEDDGDVYVMGSCYCEGGYVLLYALDGSLTVTNSNGNTKIEYNFVDNGFEDGSISFSGSFNGEVEYYSPEDEYYLTKSAYSIRPRMHRVGNRNKVAPASAKKHHITRHSGRR